MIGTKKKISKDPVDYEARTRIFWQISLLIRSDFNKISNKVDETIALLDALGEDNPALDHHTFELTIYLYEKIKKGTDYT